MDDYRESVEERGEMEECITIVDATTKDDSEYKVVFVEGMLRLLTWNPERICWDELDNMSGYELINKWVQNEMPIL